jgi:hypothetical protein
MFNNFLYSIVAAAVQKFGKTPLLMDDEMEAQYKMVYNRAMARNDASAEINLVRAQAISLSRSLKARHGRACARSLAAWAPEMKPPSLHDIPSNCSALLAHGIVTSCTNAAGLLGMKQGTCFRLAGRVALPFRAAM